ncbi:MAG: DUF4280 domain-containing protein [Niabella sp.]
MAGEKEDTITKNQVGKSTEDAAPQVGPEMDEVRQERDKEEAANEALLLVIDGAALKCDMCTNPVGKLHVNFDTPTTQEKKTATIEEKTASSLVFAGNCTKIPNSASPCSSVMQLGEWKDTGTLLVQDRKPLLKKSTIPCLYGGVDVSITDSGQVNEPSAIDTTGAPVPDTLVNGYFYNRTGVYEGHVTGQKTGDEKDVYACDGKAEKKDTFINAKKLLSDYDKFIRDASTIYGESSAAYSVVDKYEFYAIASVHKRNSIAYGVNSDYAKKFRNLSDSERDKNEAMKYSIAGEINALIGGHDYSNGAKQWDGAEQTHIPEKTPDLTSNGKFMFKVNVMGWDISDEHYKSWKSVISKKFGEKYFNVSQKKYGVANYKGMTNKNKIRLKSAAQYGLTMFWKEVDITKPKEK